MVNDKILVPVFETEDAGEAQLIQNKLTENLLNPTLDNTPEGPHCIFVDIKEEQAAFKLIDEYLDMKSYTLKKASMADSEVIWDILQDAILLRKNQGSSQWQSGYPNPEVVKNDIEQGIGYVLCRDAKIVAYAALLPDNEPAYDTIEGQWLSNGRYMAIHRIAVAAEARGLGISSKLLAMAEELALSMGLNSIKVDTNYDNAAMLAVLEKTGYSYCGEVYYQGGARKAFEKVLKIE